MSPRVARQTWRDPTYLAEHEASVAKKARIPRSLPELLTWFLAGWRAEVPVELHAFGPWRAQAARVGSNGHAVEEIPSAQLGGSLLGSPRYAEDFRALLENSPRQTAYGKPAEYDGSEVEFYVRPMRAALARLAGFGHASRPSALMARFLVQVAVA